MPADKKGPAVISVQFVNNAGMTTFASTTVTVVDPNDPKAAPHPVALKARCSKATGRRRTSKWF